MDREMDFAKLAQELRLRVGNRLMRTSECMDEHDLAAVVAGTPAADAQEQVKEHLADCDYCLARVAELARLGSAADNELQPVSDLLMARAQRFGAAGAGASLPRRLRPVHWAAAAVVVLAVAVLLQQTLPPPGTGGPNLDHSSPANATRTTSRSLDHEAMRLQITTPAPGSAITMQQAEVTWTPIEDSLYYEVFLLADNGDVLWRQRVNSTSLPLQAAPTLDAGREYYLRVDAYLAEARRVSSPHVVFTIER